VTPARESPVLIAGRRPLPAPAPRALSHRPATGGVHPRPGMPRGAGLVLAHCTLQYGPLQQGRSSAGLHVAQWHQLTTAHPAERSNTPVQHGARCPTASTDQSPVGCRAGGWGVSAPVHSFSGSPSSTPADARASRWALGVSGADAAPLPPEPRVSGQPQGLQTGSSHRGATGSQSTRQGATPRSANRLHCCPPFWSSGGAIGCLHQRPSRGESRSSPDRAGRGFWRSRPDKMQRVEIGGKGPLAPQAPDPLVGMAEPFAKPAALAASKPEGRRIRAPPRHRPGPDRWQRPRGPGRCCAAGHGVRARAGKADPCLASLPGPADCATPAARLGSQEKNEAALMGSACNSSRRMRDKSDRRWPAARGPTSSREARAPGNQLIGRRAGSSAWQLPQTRSVKAEGAQQLGCAPAQGLGREGLKAPASDGLITSSRRRCSWIPGSLCQ